MLIINKCKGLKVSTPVNPWVVAVLRPSIIFIFHRIAVGLHMAIKNISDKFATEGITFDDVLLVPAYSEVLPREVDTRSKLTRNIEVNVPLVSAAMDTVTESALAIAIAREGGIGILHKNMSIEKQAEMLRKVKRADSGLIIDPITLGENAIVAEAFEDNERE